MESLQANAMRCRHTSYRCDPMASSSLVAARENRKRVARDPEELRCAQDTAKQDSTMVVR
jgi:hypothetical protein